MNISIWLSLIANEKAGIICLTVYCWNVQHFLFTNKKCESKLKYVQLNYKLSVTVCLRTRFRVNLHAVLLNDWVFVYELSGCGYESCCSHLSVHLKLYSFIFGISYTCKLFRSMFTRVLNLLKFADDFIWYRKEFQIFGPKYLKRFVPNLNWFYFGISIFSLYFSRG